MKDYKKILEGVVDIINTTEKSDIGFANICTYIGENCPELAESENERIRKRIIHALHGDVLEMSEIKKAIAWLEKQGQQPKKHDVCDNCDQQGSCVSPCPMKLVEKQGEQKTTIEMKTPEESLGIDSDTYNKIVDECVYGEQKPDDKFHEGDWIIHQGTENIYQVVAVIDNQYQLKYGDNYTIQNCADVDRCARLWDITKDAKDGDVLCTKNKCCPFIYDKGRYNNRLAYYYAGIDVSGNLNIKSPHNMLAHFGRLDNIRPATKEQRDFLFQKMHEAGYEWDADKKELKKIEQKPAWSKEDDKMLDSIIEEVRYTGDFPDYPTKEEDELYDECLAKVEWLKSLKDRVQPQPKQEWSEGDKVMLDEIIDFFVNGTVKLQHDLSLYASWLKSLRPQSTWKPSDNELEVLRLAAEKDGACLMGLYEQLKKLKE